MSGLPVDSGECYKVIQPYLPQHDGEIELVIGDIVTNAKDLSNGWTLGRNASRDTVGIFPSGFIVTEGEEDETDVKTPIEVNTPTVLDIAKERAKSQERQIPHPIAPKPLVQARNNQNKDFHKENTGIPHTYERLSSREGTPTNPNDVYEDDLLSALEGGENDLEEYNSGSLPNQKKGKGFTRKPHMFVRPNPSKNLFRDHSDSASKLATSDSDMPDSPMSGGNKNYGASTNSTPVAKQQIRMGTPPRQHMSRDRRPSNHLTQEEPMDIDQPGTSGVIMNRATDDPAQDHSSPGLTSLEQTERQNARNENIHRNSPKMQRDGILPDSKFYQDYRTLECPVSDVPLHSAKYKPILKNRNGNYYGSPGRGGEIYYQHREDEQRSARLVVSVLAGLFCGLVLFLWMNYALGYTMMVSMFVSVSIAVLLCIFFAVSRLCRCVGALILPSMCTTRGRIAFLIIITGFLLDGPVTNVYNNMAEVSRSMSCSAEQSYNQSMLLLQPFDAMMRQLNLTVNRLQWAAQNVSHGLAPLNYGLEDSEISLLTGKRELTETEKTCKVMIDQAFSECSLGIFQAQEKCLGVIEALGTVYLEARDVLDRINPERWAPHSHVALHKRQVIPGNNDQLPDEQQDVCEPLDTITVCQALNDSEVLCQPAGWAGEAIHDAINATMYAMRTLDKTLHFQVNPEPYYNTRLNATKMAYRIRHKVNEEFLERTMYFHTVIGILKKIVPVAVLLLVYVAYVHVKNYVSKDTYDNVYITNQFKTLDQKRCEVAGESLLPLKKYERNYLIDTTMSELSLPEDGLYRIGLCVLLLHLFVSFTCYLFDYILFWILAMVQKHADPRYDYTGKDSLQLVITGEGVITDLLHVFLKGFHPANLFGYTLDMHYCLPNPTPPSILLLLVIFLLYFVLILTILLKAYILRFRNRVTAFLYPEREKARIVHLYNVVLNHRYRMPRILIQKAKVNFREKEMREQISVCHKMAAKVAPCRIFLYKQAHCLVCGSIEDQTFRDCQTERCQGVYCGECYDDINRVCPICHLASEYSDEEEYEDLEDDLQPYCRSSKIYV